MMIRLLPDDGESSNDTFHNNDTKNLFSPSSVGALHTEEWMIQPFSVLPSFIEMTMIDSVHGSLVSSLRTIVQQFQTILHNERLRHENNSNHNRNASTIFSSYTVSSSSSSTATASTAPNNNNNNKNNYQRVLEWTKQLYTIIRTSLHWLRIRIVTRVLEPMVRTYGTEVRYLLLYMIQRRCLLLSSAKVEDLMYRTCRVKIHNTERQQHHHQQQKQQSDTNNINNTNHPHPTYGNNNNNKNSSTIHKNENIPPGTIFYKLVPLERVDKIRLALLSTVGLYIREKIHDWYCCQQNKQETTVLPTTTTTKEATKMIMQLICDCVVKCYPFVIASIDMYSVWLQTKYLLGRSLHYDLTSFLLGHVVRRIVQDDMTEKSNVSLSSVTPVPSQQHQQRLVGTMGGHGSTTLLENHNSSSTKKIPTVFLLLQKSMVYAAGSLFVLGWITKVRTEWMDYQQQQTQIRQNHLDSNHDDTYDNDLLLAMDTPYEAVVIPPPPQDPTIRQRIQQQHKNIKKNSCSVCNTTPRIHPTALSVSGYVFCFSCIKPYVKRYGVCPVTGLPCTEENLVRLYEPSI